MSDNCYFIRELPPNGVYICLPPRRNEAQVIVLPALLLLVIVFALVGILFLIGSTSSDKWRLVPIVAPAIMLVWFGLLTELFYTTRGHEEIIVENGWMTVRRQATRRIFVTVFRCRLANVRSVKYTPTKRDAMAFFSSNYAERGWWFMDHGGKITLRNRHYPVSFAAGATNGQASEVVSVLLEYLGAKSERAPGTLNA